MTVRIHHLDCAHMRPVGALHPRVAPKRLVAHVLVVETDGKVVLVDTGFGREDARNPGRLGRIRATMRAELTEERTAYAQLAGLGIEAGDVTDIVMTHLDLDHAGGIKDFPNATVHVHEAELSAARGRPTLTEQTRYVPPQWMPAPQWQTHSIGSAHDPEADGAGWRGFDAAEIVGEDVVMIPLHGHTRGHCGVAVRRPGGSEAGWLLHAGDAIFDASEAGRKSSCPAGLAAYQRMIRIDADQWTANRDRLRSLNSDYADVEIIAAHDTAQFDRLAGGSGPDAG